MAVAANEYVTLEHTFSGTDGMMPYPGSPITFKHTFENEYTIRVEANTNKYNSSAKPIISYVRIDSPGIFSSGHNAGKTGSAPANVSINIPTYPEIQLADGEFNIKIENIIISGKCLVFDSITINEYKIVTEKRPNESCTITNLAGEHAIQVTKMAGGRRKKHTHRRKNGRKNGRKHRKSTRRR